MGVGDGFLALGELMGTMRSSHVYERREADGKIEANGPQICWWAGPSLPRVPCGRYVKNLLTELEQGQRKWLLTRLVLGVKRGGSLL